MADSWDEIRRKAKKQTEDTFASRISSLTRLTDEEIKEIAPEPPDREKLVQLLSIVKDSTKDNNQKAAAMKNINGLIEIAIPLLAKLL